MNAPNDVRTEAAALAARAAHSALEQLRRGARGDARHLYREAHSLLRALRRYLPELRRAA